MASSRKSNLAETVAVRLVPLLPAHSSILVGLSGGMDSVLLLHLLHDLALRYQWQISALHVHHGISPNADAWVEFCRTLCSRLNIPLQIERVDIAPLRNEHGIEAAARKLRHAAFAKQSCNFVALAHHADDQVETMLLQLLRGAGVRGAAAMPFTKRLVRHTHSSLAVTGDLAAFPPGRVAGSSIRKGWEKGGAHHPVLLRPLLDVPRTVLLDYARQHGLRWIEDESNADDNYPRNFLRHRLLPLLEEKFPAYRDTLARSAQHFAEASELLDDLARQDRQDAQQPVPSPFGGGRGSVHDTPLDISILRKLSHSRAKNLLRYFLHSIGAPMPQAAQLNDMLCQLYDARQDAVVCIQFGDWQMRRYQDKVYASPAPGEFDTGLVVSWQGEAELQWPALARNIIFQRTQGQGISFAKLQRAPVTLRLRSGSETLRPHLNAATRSLKNLLQEHHIPPWRRKRLPLLYCGDELVCVPGVAVAADFQASHSEAGIVVL